MRSKKNDASFDGAAGTQRNNFFLSSTKPKIEIVNATPISSCLLVTQWRIPLKAIRTEECELQDSCQPRLPVSQTPACSCQSWSGLNVLPKWCRLQCNQTCHSSTLASRSTSDVRQGRRRWSQIVRKTVREICPRYWDFCDLIDIRQEKGQMSPSRNQ